MYRIEVGTSGFNVYDEREVLVKTGNLKEVEDFLDHQENMDRLRKKKEEKKQRKREKGRDPKKPFLGLFRRKSYLMSA
jgi:hypothetical protein